eukprot:scaffold336_cov196-Amphora_coffeaeformis.AAC.23
MYNKARATTPRAAAGGKNVVGDAAVSTAASTWAGMGSPVPRIASTAGLGPHMFAIPTPRHAAPDGCVALKGLGVN